MIRRYTTAALVTLLSFPSSTQGFTFSLTNNQQSRISFVPSSSTTATSTAFQIVEKSTFSLNLSTPGADVTPDPADDANEATAAGETPEVVAEETGNQEGGEAEAEVAAAPEAEEEVESEEDAKIKELKTDIADLELTLKNKNRELNNIEKIAEAYTKAGYARKVAEMESYRRSKSAASADSKIVAKASVLQNFLPIVDDLKVLTEQHEGDEFAQKYSALSWDFNNAVKDLGVTDYSTTEGQKADPRRVAVVEEEYSESIAKGHVIQAVEGGYELDGNIMRMATAVVSLGMEPKEAETEDVEAEVEGEAEEGSTGEADA